MMMMMMNDLDMAITVGLCGGSEHFDSMWSNIHARLGRKIVWRRCRKHCWREL